MDKSFQKNLLVCILLGLVTLGVYWPVFKCEFVKYDDDVYVTDNWRIQSGFNRDSISRVFTSGYASNWHPVTWLSHMLDWQLFGGEAWGHHLTNLLLHIANTVLLFAVFRRMTGAVWASGFVAAAFALHPLHVESVAWVAERKDVLSALFWILTMWCYVRYVEKPKVGRYFAALLFFALGLMSKPMVVTLPFVLLLLDRWPLERKGKAILNLFVEKIPFFVLSVGSGVVTFFVQRSGGSVSGIEVFGMKGRVSNALVSYFGYIDKMIWPRGLAIFYPHPANSLPIAEVIKCGFLLMLVCVLFLWLWRRKKYLAVGWLWYVGTLVPVIGLVQVGSQAMADRYTYIPLIGLFIVIAWGASEFAAGWRYRKVILSILAVAVLIGMSIGTRLQLRHWRDSAALFKHTLAVTKGSFFIHNNYANVLKDSGKVAEAIEHYNIALKISPNSAEVYNNFGDAVNWLGEAEGSLVL
ncbi:MAG: glycosyltransferase family 39 protein [Planctomycetes bacterium]|nr:glycosyltransferase family 39 protein [Planctomycetota bacterium]